MAGARTSDKKLRHRLMCERGTNSDQRPIKVEIEAKNRWEALVQESGEDENEEEKEDRVPDEDIGAAHQRLMFGTQNCRSVSRPKELYRSGTATADKVVESFGVSVKNRWEIFSPQEEARGENEGMDWGEVSELQEQRRETKQFERRMAHGHDQRSWKKEQRE